MLLINLVNVAAAITSIKSHSGVVIFSSFESTSTHQNSEERLFSLLFVRRQAFFTQILNIEVLNSDFNSSRIEGIINRKSLASILLIGFVRNLWQLNLFQKVFGSTELVKLEWLLIADDYFLNDIKELYSWPLDNKITVLTFGRVVKVWDIYRAAPYLESKKTEITSLNLSSEPSQYLALRDEPWKYRLNLSGLNIRCISDDWEPFMIVKENEGDGSLEISGFIGSIWSLLKESLQFRPKDGRWGKLNKTTGRFDGLLGELARNESDVGVSHYANSEERRKFLDFSAYINRIVHILVTRRPGAISGPEKFTSEFSRGSWITVVIFFFLSLLTLYIFTRVHTVPRWSISDCFITSIRIWYNMGYSEFNLQSIPFRIFIFVTLVSTFLLHVYYNAFLIAILSSSSNNLPFDDLEGLYRNRDEWDIGIDSYSSITNLFKASDSKLLRSIQRDMINRNPQFIEPPEDGMKRVAENSNHVFLINKDYYSHNFKDCKFFIVADGLFTTVTYLPTRKNLPMAPIMNYRMAEMVENGIIDKLQRDWKINEEFNSDDCIIVKTEAIGFQEISSAFILLVIGVVGAVVIFILEKLLGIMKVLN